MKNFLNFFLGMVAIDLPLDDTRDVMENWVKKEPEIYHIEFLNNMQRTIRQGEMVIAYPWCGLADGDVEDGHVGTIYVQASLLVRSSRIASGSNFNQGPEAGALATQVWYDPITRNYHDTMDAGRYMVGNVREPVDADGVFGFEKNRFVVTGIES